MKKYLLSISLFFFLISQCYSQKVTTTIKKNQFGDFKCNYSKLSSLDNDDISYEIEIMFQNREFSNISDYAFLLFFYNEDKIEFINDLIKLIPYAGKNSTVTIDKLHYSISVKPKGTIMVIRDSDSKYGYINTTEVNKMIAWLKTCKLLY